MIQALTKDGWFRTGDVALINEDGFIFIVDRIKDIVIRGGENISCTEVYSEVYTTVCYTCIQYKYARRLGCCLIRPRR